MKKWGENNEIKNRGGQHGGMGEREEREKKNKIE